MRDRFVERYLPDAVPVRDGAPLAKGGAGGDAFVGRAHGEVLPLFTRQSQFYQSKGRAARCGPPARPGGALESGGITLSGEALLAVASAPATFRVRVWHLMSCCSGPRTGRPPPEEANVGYAL